VMRGFGSGDFRPLIEDAQMIGRGFTSAMGYLAAGAPQDPRIAQVQAQQDARRLESGDTSFQQRAQRQAELEQRAQAFDPSLSGRITRGVVREGIKLAP